MKQGMRGARPSTFSAGQMYRQGNRGLLAVLYSIGTLACCMTLCGVKLMGSNVLKYTRDTSLWFAEYSGPWQQRLQRVQLKKSWKPADNGMHNSMLALDPTRLVCNIIGVACVLQLLLHHFKARRFQQMHIKPLLASEMVVCPAVMAACIGSCALSLHRAYDISYDITHDIIILYYDIILWYHVWYHSMISYMISYNDIILWYYTMISYYDISYDIINLTSYAWGFCSNAPDMWYHNVISQAMIS